MMQMYYTEFESPLGRLRLLADEHCLHGVFSKTTTIMSSSRVGKGAMICSSFKERSNSFRNTLTDSAEALS